MVNSMRAPALFSGESWMTNAPSYLVTLCEGERCRPLVAIADHDDAANDHVERATRLEATLQTIAKVLRAKGAVGRLFLQNQQTGDLIATRHV